MAVSIYGRSFNMGRSDGPPPFPDKLGGEKKRPRAITCNMAGLKGCIHISDLESCLSSMHVNLSPTGLLFQQAKTTRRRVRSPWVHHIIAGLRG